jgi:hypothetical protein
MSTNKKDNRERLFSIYSQNLSLYYPDVIDKFRCPICKKLFSRKDLECSPPKITLAHIIPRSLAGTLVTLSCKQCNDKIGYNLETHLAKEKKNEDFKQGKCDLLARLKTNHGQLVAELSCTNSRLNIRNLPHRSDPKCSEKIISDAIKNWSKFKFTVEYETFNHEKRNIALIHSAFLMMFYYFGYEYVLSPNVEPIRELILSPKVSDVSYKRAIVTFTKASEYHYHNPNVSILVTPQEMRSFLIEFPPPNKSTLARCVLLPGFGKDGKKAYNHILAVNFGSANLNLKLIPYDDSRLTNPEYKWFGHKMWGSLSKM